LKLQKQPTMTKLSKYRGKKVNDKEWIYFDFQKYWENPHSKSEPFLEYVLENVCIFTGFLDKKGVNIYQGDLVRWDDGSNGEKWRVAVVEMVPSLQFRIVKIHCDYKQSGVEGKVFSYGNFAYKDLHNHLEVIGNVIDNKDLLVNQSIW
jgi:YopX protein